MQHELGSLDIRAVAIETAARLEFGQNHVRKIASVMFQVIREHLVRAEAVKLPDIGLLHYAEKTHRPHNGRRKRVEKTSGYLAFKPDSSVNKDLENMPAIRQRALEIMAEQLKRQSNGN